MALANLFSFCRRNVPEEEGFAVRNKLFYDNIVTLDDDSYHMDFEHTEDDFSEHAEETSSIINNNFANRKAKN